MIIALHRPCRDHRAVLLDWVDRRAVGPSTAAALAHLDRCRRCEGELAGVALAILALRRLQRDMQTVEPPPDAWARLRARVDRPVQRWRSRVNLGGLAASAVLVALLVMPRSVGGAASAGGALLPVDVDALRRESAYLAAARANGLPPAPRTPHDSGAIRRLYPQEIAEVRKEVTAAGPASPPREPI